MLQQLKLLSHRVNEGIRFTDPNHYEDAKKLRESVERKHPFAKALGKIDTLVYEGHQILLNIRSGEHVDRHDPKRSFAGLTAFGGHKGGYLVFPELGIRVRLEPRDGVFLRGRMLRHFVQDWEGGQRICIAHFTHSTVWRMEGMGHLVGLDEIESD
jgi:hypothetical protein